MALPRFGRRPFLLGGVAAVISIPLIGEVYSRSGSVFQNISVGPLPSPKNGWDSVEELTLVFHGAGGPDSYTDELMQKLSEGKTSDGGETYSTMVDWSEYSQNILQASFNGERVGDQLANQLLTSVTEASSSLKSLHIIGISVGAFAADRCVTQFKKERKNENGVNVQLTLLDPFCQRGVIGPFYGERTFGRTADYAQQYLNTDDPVPSTNSIVSHCAVTDVTNVRPVEIFGHDWPLVYYSKLDNVGMVPLKDQRSRGDILKINLK